MATPMVVLVGDSHREYSWKNMTQESRQIDILRPACKEILRVEVIQAYHPLDTGCLGMAFGEVGVLHHVTEFDRSPASISTLDVAV